MSPGELDHALLRAARTRGHCAWAERAVAAFSRTGEHGACWIAFGIWRRAPRGAQAVAGAYAVNYLVKLAVRRRRPRLPGLPPLTGTVSRLSFPSAHATTSFAAARAYRGLAPGWVLYGVASAFALSRPYLGVHYPSDVLAGAVLGTVVAGVWPGGAREGAGP